VEASRTTKRGVRKRERRWDTVGEKLLRRTISDDADPAAAASRRAAGRLYCTRMLSHSMRTPQARSSAAAMCGSE
jgi:hypothetical protein